MSSLRELVLPDISFCTDSQEDSVHYTIFSISNVPRKAAMELVAPKMFESSATLAKVTFITDPRYFSRDLAHVHDDQNVLGVQREVDGRVIGLSWLETGLPVCDEMATIEMYSRDSEEDIRLWLKGWSGFELGQWSS